MSRESRRAGRGQRPVDTRTATRMPDIFLSYANEDRATAERLVEVFSREGWEVFWDRAIPIGKSWDEVLDEKLPAARAITALWSPYSVESRWVRTEADFGMEHRKLFPAMIRPAHVPISFRLVQYADLSTWAGASTDHGELQRLLDALRRHLGTEPLQERPAESDLIPLETKPSADPIFLGYARDDRARAEALVQALERSGLPVWWDFSIPVGESFESSIQRALESSGAVLILWSPRGLASDWVRAEAEWALGRRKLVGVKVEPVALPPEFGGAPSIDLSGWSGSRSYPEFVRLLQVLGSVSRPDEERHERERPRRIRQALLAMGIVLALLTLLLVTAPTWRGRGASNRAEGMRELTSAPVQESDEGLEDRATSGAIPSPTSEEREGTGAARLSRGESTPVARSPAAEAAGDTARIQSLDREIASRLATFERALDENQQIGWQTPTTYQNVLWFPDVKPSDLYPALRSYQFKALIQELSDLVPEEEREAVDAALATAVELERHRDRVKARDPNQLEKPPREIEELLTQILPKLRLARWTRLPSYQNYR